jgi:hypothetical protein
VPVECIDEATDEATDDLPPMPQPMGNFTCYIHDVDDPNETPYDPKEHDICVLCARKLEVLGDAGICWINKPHAREYTLVGAPVMLANDV